jgi:hypothetical protein
MLKKIKSSTHRVTMCKKCYTFYYRNTWNFDKPMTLETDQDEDIPVHFTKCTACLEQESAFYEREPELVMGIV